MRVFSIDYRSLALFRKALGLVLLYSLATLAAVGDMVLARDGIFPANALERYFRGSWSWSVNSLIDATWFHWLILGLAAAAVASMIVGWHTRVSTIAAWVLVTSTYKSVNPVLGGGDILLNVLLFWAMFLPLGARWSLDARRKPPLEQESLTSAATAAILLQMAFIYLFTGISKLNDVWFSGSALGIGYSIDRITRPLGHWLAGFPWLTAQLSRSTLVAELLLPFVLFAPWKSKWCRSVALLLLIAFHIGIEATMVVGMFSYAALAGLTLFVPSFWWSHPPLKRVESLLDRLFGAPTQPRPVKHSRDKRESQRPREGAQGLPFGRLLRGTAITALVLYVLLYNLIVSFASADVKRGLGFFQRWGELLSLQQYWDMFNDPSANCNEIACVARLRDGTRIDLLRDNIVVSDPTTFPSQPAKYDRLRKMIWASVVTHPNNRVFLESFVRYVCREYGEDSDDPAKQIMECSLVYYPYGPNPYAKKFSFAEVQSVKLRGG